MAQFKTVWSEATIEFVAPPHLYSLIMGAFINTFQACCFTQMVWKFRTVHNRQTKPIASITRRIGNSCIQKLQYCTCFCCCCAEQKLVANPTSGTGTSSLSSLKQERRRRSRVSWKLTFALHSKDLKGTLIQQDRSFGYSTTHDSS